MTCTHLRRLYQLCEDNGLKLSSSDLIRITCTECGKIEVCPAALVDQYESNDDDPPKIAPDQSVQHPDKVKTHDYRPVAH